MEKPPDSTKPSLLLIIPWMLSLLVSLLAVGVWGGSLAWNFSGISTYQIFPVLGLLAFSLMWAHYMVGLMRRTFLKNADLHVYFSYTGYIVLIAIVLHPGLLAYQRFRDGFGLPPDSELNYVMPGLAWVVLLGIVSFFIFLAFELRRWFGRRRWWPYLLYANDLAMLAIFYHGLELGTQTHITWFRNVWWFYGITLILTLIYKYTRQLRGLEPVREPIALDE